ncbi:hypothetical protein P154DRAFT_583737 [Amniculicola lignicola CBS 123094]|uniref:Uncharacterized protein n=1 Tax=Amniculicola lignicola CBS 123094 TaxID=1392246 RepID=A0A6A5VS51_9PLEO|nr:hypothetical protein P154DRAFT_583737 [Amniculicola lignicola CBS 123094]
MDATASKLTRPALLRPDDPTNTRYTIGSFDLLEITNANLRSCKRDLKALDLLNRKGLLSVTVLGNNQQRITTASVRVKRNFSLFRNSLQVLIYGFRLLLQDPDLPGQDRDFIAEQEERLQILQDKLEVGKSLDPAEEELVVSIGEEGERAWWLQELLVSIDHRFESSNAFLTETEIERREDTRWGRRRMGDNYLFPIRPTFNTNNWGLTVFHQPVHAPSPCTILPNPSHIQ